LGRKGKILPALEEVFGEGETEHAGDKKEKRKIKKQREKLWILINDINI
jgi:hypothetical protein